MLSYKSVEREIKNEQDIRIYTKAPLIYDQFSSDQRTADKILSQSLIRS